MRQTKGRPVFADIAARRLWGAEGAAQRKVDILDGTFAQQRAFIEDPAKLKWALCTRRAAKSYSDGLALAKAALDRPDVSCLYIGLTRESAKADRGVSLDAQRVKLKAYAELYELDLVEVIVDVGESAKSLDRPGLQRALRMLKAGEAEALLVVKLDRLTRSVVDLGTLVERYFAPGKAALLSVGEQIDTRSAAGRLVLNVLASVSQWEREAIGERTATAMQHKARQGEYTGGWAPYGRRVALDGARLEPDPQEEAARAAARQLRAQGLSLRAVAAELERRGVRSRTGSGFAPVQVARMVA